MTDYICEYCNKELANSYSFDRHKSKCKLSIQAQSEQTRFRTENEKLKEEIQNLLVKIAKLETATEIYRKQLEDTAKCISDIAKQPKKIVSNINSNNKYANLSMFNMTKDTVMPIIEDKFTEEHFLKGQLGVAHFTYDNVLLDTHKNSRYRCSNMRDKSFVYKCANGQLAYDMRAKQLTNILKDGVINKSLDIYKRKIESETDIGKQAKYATTLMDIKSIGYDNTKFTTELTHLVVNNIVRKIPEIEFVIE